MSRDIAIALRAPWRALVQRGARSRTRRRRRLTASAKARRRMLVVAVAVVAAAGGWFWLRDSSLVAVTHVKVTGLSGADAPAVRSALTDAAHDMTTMHVSLDRLRTAVAPYPIVKDIRVTTSFPHEMRIVVIEHDAVAAVTIDGARVGVAADGTLLRGRPALAQLVTLSVPSANGGGRLSSYRGRAAVAVMGAAPAALRPYVSDIAFGPDGLRVILRNGPLLQFGDARRARAKWIAAARVLGDPRAAGASYLDLRAPERPVAGRFDDPGATAALDGTSALATAAQQATSDTQQATTSAQQTSTDAQTATTTDGQATTTDSQATTTDSQSATTTTTTTTPNPQAGVNGQ